MKVLVVEDQEYKFNDIKSALERLNADCIDWFQARNSALRHLLKNHEYDLIVLDMQFPIYEGEHIEPDAGFDFLRELERKEYNIPVLICSSNDVVVEDVDFYIGSIKYDSSVDLLYSFNKLLNKEKETQER